MGGRLSPGVVLVLMLLAAAASATPPAVPTSARVPLRPLAQVDQHALPSVDVLAARLEDEARLAAGDPTRFAIPEDVYITPAGEGTWEDAPRAGVAVWRLRITAPGCLTLNLGCERFDLPPGGRLVVHAADGRGPVRVFTERDERPHGELWTPVVPGDALVVEMTLPLRARDDYDLAITRVGKGYRMFGEVAAEKAGSCNVDVACPEGDPWRAEIASTAFYTFGGGLYCTGTLVNNTLQDGRPLFLTAAHCGVTALNAASVVVYWNFESPVCGDQAGGSLDDAQSGATHLATFSTSDFTLVELDADPNPTWGVAWAGWDRSFTVPDSVVTIHHPSGDEKSISFDRDVTEVTSQQGYTSPGDGSHLRVVAWDLGTTEGGSSGAPLFDKHHHLVGQLYGGFASCLEPWESDWFGRLAVSWEGGGTPSTRLRDWLDPVGSGAVTLDTWAPGARGMQVTPATGLASQGEMGGPFAPASVVHTLENLGDEPVTYAVTADQDWVVVTGGTGTLGPNATAEVTVSIGPAAEALTPGFYDAAVTFTNLTDGAGDTQRPVSLQVGTIAVHHAWNMDTDPGWAREGLWDWGVPQGTAGEDHHGYLDPTSGYTGNNVMGYNLAGDYENDLPPTYLTTGPIDCRALQAVSLRFRRWLGVEVAVYDTAAVEISTDGESWSTVWRNGAQVTDPDWQLVEYDLSAVADYRDTVYLRWVMGPTDEAWRYCGWNLDDVEILGLYDPTVGVEDRPDEETPPALPDRLAVRSYPNPFNPRTTVAFDVPRAQHVRVTVHDARGRRLRVLHAGTVPAGTTTVDWDGRDARGRPLASGVYFVLVSGAYHEVVQKVALLK